MQPLLLVLAAVAVYAGWSAAVLFNNYSKARRSGFKLTYCPVDPNSIQWMIFSVSLRKPLQRYLPAAVYRSIETAIFGWEGRTNHSVQDRVGDNFLMVTPGTMELYVADPESAMAVFTRRKDFIGQVVTRKVMGAFGGNVLVADGEDWQRQRRIIAPIVNEKISKATWEDGTKQAQEMLESFTTRVSKSEDGVTDEKPGVNNETLFGLRSVAINVLGSVGYGTWQSWSSDEMKVPRDRAMNFLEAMTVITNYLVASTFLSPKLLGLALMPQVVKDIGAAAVLFPLRTQELIADERQKNPHATRTTMASVLIGHSDDEKRQQKASGSRSALWLSEQELQGNLYIFTLAGFDTTANTMAYAVTLLAAYPQWQEWMAQQIVEVTRKNPEGTYEQVFPLLTRCLAVMFETLRLNSPVQHVARSTDTEQPLSIKGRDYLVPAGVTVYISIASIHFDRRIWGDDVAEFRPSRWLNEKEQIREMPRGAFVPWGYGPRVCPGMKMSQVEFTSVMAKIYGACTINAAPRDGETPEAAREYLKEVMVDSQPRVTQQMNRPRDVRLQWLRR